MSNFEFEHDDDQINVSELVAQYEKSVNGEQAPFFDQDDYEVIIEYYEDMGRFEDALSVADRSLLQYPYSAMLLLKKAHIYFELKQLNPALELLDKAEIYDSSEIGIFLLRAEIFTFQSRYKEAITILHELLEKTEKEDLPDVYLQMCDVYEDWEKYYDVYSCLIECLKIDPNNEEALNRMNYCVEITDKFEDSIPFHLYLIDINPYNHFAWYNLACAYRGCNEYEKQSMRMNMYSQSMKMQITYFRILQSCILKTEHLPKHFPLLKKCAKPLRRMMKSFFFRENVMKHWAT
jgi:tetratricopeptide (TPR) repeat protein